MDSTKLNPDASLFNEEDHDILKNNRRVRTMLLNALVKDGEIPKDTEAQKMALAIMKDLDAEVLTRAKIKVASKTEQGITNLASLVGKALSSYRPGTPLPITTEQRRLPDAIRPSNIVPGEMDIGMLPLTLDDVQET